MDKQADKEIDKEMNSVLSWISLQEDLILTEEMKIVSRISGVSWVQLMTFVVLVSTGEQLCKMQQSSVK